MMVEFVIPYINIIKIKKLYINNIINIYFKYKKNISLTI